MREAVSCSPYVSDDEVTVSGLRTWPDFRKRLLPLDHQPAGAQELTFRALLQVYQLPGRLRQPASSSSGSIGSSARPPLPSPSLSAWHGHAIVPRRSG